MDSRLKKHFKRLVYADDATEGVSLLLRLRIPWLIIGLLIGSLVTFIVSRFQTVLSSQVSVAFFIPIIVYMSDAVGTQTETIYVRNLSLKQAKFSIYLVKEVLLGLMIGALIGSLLSLFAFFWLNSAKLALTILLAMSASITSATVIALIVPTILHKLLRIDPAVGSGPFTTGVQNVVSLLIYFVIASLIIL